jgi:hypothetical protein
MCIFYCKLAFMTNADLAKQFSASNWLANLGEADESATVLLQKDYENDADAFFAHPYADPYESWCVAEYEKALKILPNARNAFTEQVAKNAYLTAWKQLPHPEVCGLISEDVQTILSLLTANEPLSEFTKARMNWYIKGRMPWGYIVRYIGDFPNGRWIIL